MAWLLDTNILSESAKPRPEPRVVEFIRRCSLSEQYINVVTFAEIGFGIECLEDSDRRDFLKDWLNLTLRPMFKDRVLPLSENVILIWRGLLAEGRKTGHTYSQPDLLIAATALHHGFTVVTRDRRDFDRANVPVFNPWES